jgi:DDE superfamily endonuclease
MRAVIDTQVGQKYEAEPGRQGWITVMECICADGSSIAPMIIFKGENISKSWIPVEELKAVRAEGWHISCNTKGWTSNEHGLEWLKKSFEPATRDKANSEYRLLICDGHDSHISADFIRHCIANRIVLFLLPPHCSHLMQPLDVGVFFPLKQATGCSLKRYYQTGIARLQNAEWFVCFIKARDKALTTKNIKAGWRGAGIYPMDPSKVLQKLPQVTPESTRPSTPTNAAATIPAQPITAEDLFNVLPDGHSSIDATTLHAVTTALNDLVRTKQALHTPARKFIPRLASTTQWLLAENAILKLELQQTKAVLGGRKVRTGGKRLVLKGKIVMSTEEILKAIEEAEAATQVRTGRGRGRPRGNVGTGRPRGRPRKNAPAVPIVTVVEVEADDGGSESDPDL